MWTRRACHSLNLLVVAGDRGFCRDVHGHVGMYEDVILSTKEAKGE